MKKSLAVVIFSLFAVVVHGIHTSSRRRKDNEVVEEKIEEKDGKTFYRGQIVHSAPAQIM